MTTHSTDCTCGICKPITPDATALDELAERNRLAQNATTAQRISPAGAADAIGEALGYPNTGQGNAKLARDLSTPVALENPDQYARQMVARQNEIRNVRQAMGAMLVKAIEVVPPPIPSFDRDTTNAKFNAYIEYIGTVESRMDHADAIRLALHNLMRINDDDSFFKYWNDCAESGAVGALDCESDEVIARIAFAWMNSYTIDDAARIEREEATEGDRARR